MREIKYKVLDKSSQEFISDNGLTLKEIQNINNLDHFEFYEYTGLKDKNGVDVFKSDKISGLGLTMTIVFSEEDCAFIATTKTGQAFINQEYLDNFEVIGNIYETKNYYKYT